MHKRNLFIAAFWMAAIVSAAPVQKLKAKNAVPLRPPQRTATPTPTPKPITAPARAPLVPPPPTPTPKEVGFDISQYGEWLQLEAPPPDVLKWDLGSGFFITLSPAGPVIHLTGNLNAGYTLTFDDQAVALLKNHFDIVVPLNGDPRLREMRIIDREHGVKTYHMVFFWNHPLIVPGYVPPVGQRLGFAQLYSGDTPTITVDLDSVRGAALSFRLYLPPGADPKCERWDLVVENKVGREVARVSNKGYPPAFVDWRDLQDRVQLAGEYSYRLRTTYAGKTLEGHPNRFQIFYGTHFYEHRYDSNYKLEPRQELGLAVYRSTVGVTYQTLYLGTDLGFAFKNHWLFRLGGMTAMPGTESNGQMTFFRFAAGVRFGDYRFSNFWGAPFLYQVDALIGYSSFFLGPQLQTSRFGSPSALLEAKFVIRSQHFVIPSLEYGIISLRSFQRFSAGLQYAYYIRPWDLAVGIGVGYDQLLRFEDAPNLRFTMLRGMTTMTFFL